MKRQKEEMLSKEEQMRFDAVKRRNDEAIANSKNLHILKNLAKHMKGCWHSVFCAWIFVVVEVALEVLIPFMSQYLIDTIQVASGEAIDIGKLTMYASIMAGMAVVSCFAGIFAGFFAATAAARFGRNLRQAMYYKVQEFSFANIDKFSSASLVTRMTTDVTNVQFSLQMIVRTVVRAPLMLIFAMIMTAVINPQLSLIFLCVLPVLAAVLFGIAIGTHPIFVRIFNAYDDLNASVQENLSGIRVVKSFAREEYEKKKFGRISYFIYRSFVKAERILAFNSPAMQLAIYTSILLVSWFGANIIIQNGNGGTFTTGSLTSMFTYTMQILNALMFVSMAFVMITISRNSSERIVEVLLEEPSLVSPENALTEVPNGAVDFDHVNFRYFKDGEKDVLHDIDIHIPSGSTVGIIGATGSSKTTLISMIARLYDVNEGSVKVGGHDVREYDLKVLRDSVAVVLQKNVLFSGTIKSNLLWGNENATDEEIEHACKLACADEFIQTFPLKYESPIEQGGTNVSGGQKQRLCIARALLKKPKILILDDSTSAVDTATDAKIRKAFAEEIPDTTKFIVAQRLLSIKDCDQIIIMDDGKILDMGTNDELMARSEVYREIYETQLGGGDFDAE